MHALQSLFKRLARLFRLGGATDDSGYLHEALFQQQLEPARTHHYLETGEQGSIQDPSIIKFGGF